MHGATRVYQIARYALEPSLEVICRPLRPPSQLLGLSLLPLHQLTPTSATALCVLHLSFLKMHQGTVSSAESIG